MTHRQIVLCSPVRTAIGTYKGALQDIPTVALGATVIRETVARSGLDPSQVQTVIMGASHDRQPGLRFRRSGDCLCGPGSHARSC